MMLDLEKLTNLNIYLIKSYDHLDNAFAFLYYFYIVMREQGFCPYLMVLGTFHQHFLLLIILHPMQLYDANTLNNIHQYTF